jgi:Acetyltransferase (GNAT) family
MSMYGDYIKERLNDEIVESEYGFATYRYIDKAIGRAVYIVDIYVNPAFRKSGEAARLADRIVAIAKNYNCTELIGTVSPTSRTATESIKVLLAYGMTLKSSTMDALIFTKNI